jgi:glycosyltransferase involved in cell wall biosynthesis
MYGGIETLLATLATRRDACPEMRPEFGLCFDGRIAGELRTAGVPVDILGEVRFSRPWTVWSARRRLSRRLRENRPDVVVTHACWPHALFARAVRERGIALAMFAHDVGHPEHWIDRKAARTPPDRVIANSRYTAQGVESLFPGTPREVAYPPVAPRTGDRGRRSALRREFQTADDAVVILMASRLEAWKGHEFLLEALEKLRFKEGWTCWIAGGAQRDDEQAYLSRLKDLATRHGVAERVRWLGQRSDIPDVMAGADVYCQPNIGPEPFGIVFVEALAAGLPVIAAGIGGSAEIVDDACGRTVLPHHAPILASALATLIDDSELRRNLAVNGPERARALCDPSRQIPLIHSLLEPVAPR